jgi:hypothetical protein
MKTILFIIQAEYITSIIRYLWRILYPYKQDNYFSSIIVYAIEHYIIFVKLTVYTGFISMEKLFNIDIL